MPGEMSNRTIDNVIVLSNLITAVCEANNVKVYISKSRLLEVIIHFRKDLVKLEYHQNRKIALNKHVAGLTFWIRRLKPIQKAHMIGDARDIRDINEQIAIWLMHELLVICADSSYVIKSVNEVPLSSSARSKNIEEFLARYWFLDDYFNYTSLVYNLRYRNISPHHMALLLDAIVAGFVLKHTSFAN